MANELTVKFSISYTNGNDSVTLPAITQQQTVASTLRVQGVQEIGTSEEALALGDVASDGGAFYARNLDTTNYVEIGLTGSYVIRLDPGEICFLSGVSSRNLYARANTAAVRLAYMLWSP